MIHYTHEIKRAIYDCINSKEEPLGRYSGNASFEELNVVDFLKLIWDLPSMPSEDSRFRNAEADAYQHMINNDDWTLEYALLTRFNLLVGEDEYFTKYVEAIVSPEVRKSLEEIEDYVKSINSLLKTIRCELAIVDFINQQPYYRLMEGLEHTIPPDIETNNIPIFIDTERDKFPAFYLETFMWDDFGHKTRYKLWYYSEKNIRQKIGVVKIMNRNNNITYDVLSGKKYMFEDSYCSLGTEISYYQTIRDLLGASYKNFLFAMRDAACFSQICDDFNETRGFRNSLLRDRSAETALNYAIYVLAGFDINIPTTFVFHVIIPYHTQEFLPIKFDFGQLNTQNNLNRTVALIGNNGVGKTTILSQIAECIAKGERDRFAPHQPIFSKVISASYSIFDSFYKIEGSSFNYSYCGIQNKDRSLMSFKDQAKRRRKSIKIINYHDRNKLLCNYLGNLLPKDVINDIFDGEKFIEEKFDQLHLSSGQSMLMNLTIEIVANIRQNTLILLDEPEIHLHPKGVTTIITIINKLCNDFSSCCIMATHSSLIIQNLLSRNVIILDREPDGSPIVRPMRVESLGENLTTITDDIFGRGEISPYYLEIVRTLVASKKNLDDILKSIQNNDVPISMSLRILIDKYISSNDQYETI